MSRRLPDLYAYLVPCGTQELPSRLPCLPLYPIACCLVLPVCSPSLHSLVPFLALPFPYCLLPSCRDLAALCYYAFCVVIWTTTHLPHICVCSCTQFMPHAFLHAGCLPCLPPLALTTSPFKHLWEEDWMPMPEPSPLPTPTFLPHGISPCTPCPALGTCLSIDFPGDSLLHIPHTHHDCLTLPVPSPWFPCPLPLATMGLIPAVLPNMPGRLFLYLQLGRTMPLPHGFPIYFTTLPSLHLPYTTYMPPSIVYCHCLPATTPFFLPCGSLDDRHFHFVTFTCPAVAPACACLVIAMVGGDCSPPHTTCPSCLPVCLGGPYPCLYAPVTLRCHLPQDSPFSLLLPTIIPACLVILLPLPCQFMLFWMGPAPIQANYYCTCWSPPPHGEPQAVPSLP